MQVDDPARGFTYKYQGPLDMRMNTIAPHESHQQSHSINNMHSTAPISSVRINNIAPHDDEVLAVNAAVEDDDTGGAVGDSNDAAADDEARASNLTIAGGASSAVTAYAFLCGLKHPRQLSDILQANRCCHVLNIIIMM